MRKEWLLILGCVVSSALWAFPTQSEIKTAGAVVGALVKGDIDAAKAGKAKHVEVADKIYGLVADAESEGAKWLLLKHAFIQYAKGGDYDKAADMMREILAQFPDVPPAQALALISNNAARAKPDNAARLLKFRDLLTMRQKCAAVLANPKATRQQKAEAQCLTGNWKDGLAALSKLGGEVGEIAAKELTAEKPSIDAANFWWDYKSSLDTCGAFRAHAVEIYEKGLADGSLTGLYRNLAEQRIAENKQASVALAASSSSGKSQYMIIDLSSGPNSKHYPVTYSGSRIVSNWPDKYKTTKLVLKRIEPGKFMLCGQWETTISKPYYVGVFLVTQKQWALVMGSDPCASSTMGSGDAYPIHDLNYCRIRGDHKGGQWPASADVDDDSFLAKLQSRTGLKFDLPTEAQWEYACRAGTTTSYSYGNEPDGDYMWYRDNAEGKTHPVGKKKPNPWGLYDMHGNVMEWCLDWYGGLSYGVDPKGPSSSNKRVMRGRSWDASDCSSSCRFPEWAGCGYWHCGFRLACPVTR